MLPGLVFVSHRGETKEVRDLIGKTFSSLTSSEQGIIASCNDGIYNLTSAEGSIKQLSRDNFKVVTAGRGFFVAIGNKNELYSWGNSGLTGQLGQGICHQSVAEPTQLNHDSQFISIACGEAFSLALDQNGTVYSWGENFDRQLGLYQKNKANMRLANAMVEEVSFVPRLVPLSKNIPVAKIACGARFALAVTKIGVVYSWGAGECGQLGTGRCTRREVLCPVQIIEPSIAADCPSQSLFRDVAAGDGHAVAVAADGRLYSWGLNHCAQLGLGHHEARHYPQQIDFFLRKVMLEDDERINQYKFDDLVLVKAFTGGHSSAAIDAKGRLFTWGCTAHDRLLHHLPKQRQVPVPVDATLALVSPESSRARIARAAQDAILKLAAADKVITSLTRPTLVRTRHLTDRRVESFAFSKSLSAALVLTTFSEVIPTTGPRRSFSKIVIHGDGFWDSPLIIAKFTFKRPLPNNSGYVDSNAGKAPPRSCSAKFIDPGTLTCRPPKFPETGIFSVSISMDGTHFLDQSVDVWIHQDLSVQSLHPMLHDLRTPQLDMLKLSVVGVPSLPLDWSGSYQVKLSFTSGDDISAARNRANATDLETFVIDAVAHPVDAEADQTGPSPALHDDDAVSFFCCTNIDLTALQQRVSSGIFEMRCQFSINGQDFSVLKYKADGGSNPNPSTLLYKFCPESLYPSCFPLVGESSDSTLTDTEVTVIGNGFLPANRLPRGSKTVASLNPVLDDIAWTPAAAAVSSAATAGLSLNSILAPIRCDSSNKISVIMNKSIFKQLQELSGALNRSISKQLKKEQEVGTQYINILPIKFGFELTVSKQTMPLCEYDDSLRMNFYTDQPLLLIPNCTNLRSSLTTQLSIFVNRSSFADGFDFISDDLVIAVHVPVLHSEGTVDQSPQFYPPTIIRGSAVVVTALSDASRSTKYLVQTEIQSFRHYLHLAMNNPVNGENGDPENFDSYQHFYISVWPDGKSIPSSDCWGKVYIYRDLARDYTLLPAAPPKTGFTAGTAITLQLTSYCPIAPSISPSLMALLSDEVKNSIIAQQCMVGVRGSEDAIIPISGKVDVSADNAVSIEFVIPDGLRSATGMTAVQKTPKEKPMYFVDVSLDGGSTFDHATVPLLNLK